MAKKSIFSVNPITGEEFYHGFQEIDMKEFYASRKPFEPELGYFYRNQGSNATFRCVAKTFTGKTVLQNVRSKWTFTAHGVGKYSDNSIDWDYSTNGFYAKE